MTIWTQQEAIALCRDIEAISPRFGLHVALTGGLLYKDGERKDADILLYRIREEQADFNGLFSALRFGLGIELIDDFGWCKKATWRGKPIDFFDPEASGEYPADPANAFDLFEDIPFAKEPTQ
jgi:hypothetical protein